MVERYECDQSGACCRQLIVEADAIDVIREPKLIDADRFYRGKTLHEVVRLLSEEGRALSVACGKCSMLDGNVCSIYPTRPNECVAMEAGDDQCQQSRKAEGLPRLLPVESES